ncbi:MAG TPA: hypothetical protein VFZ03_12035 [Dongiaceae bacterium]
MPRKARVLSRELKLAAVHRMLAGENVSALARELKEEMGSECTNVHRRRMHDR